ncbi:MAG: LytTR family DNA-binding domain-containing protein [Eubacteriales bacterium]
MKLRALLVDDESPARKELRFLLQSFPDIQIVGEAANSLEALELINNMQYSIIFLDIDMPGLNGLDLARQLLEKDNPPAVIFTTAHEEFAFEAFNVHAYDYLLKPVSSKRLEEAIITVRKRLKQDCSTQQTASKKSNLDTSSVTRMLTVVPAEQNGKTILIHPEEIIFISTDKDKIYIKTENKSFLTRFTLRELETRLDPKMFFRTHRCYLVNLRKMRELVPYFNGTYTVIVEDQEKSEVPVSRTQARKLKNILGL